MSAAATTTSTRTSRARSGCTAWPACSPRSRSRLPERAHRNCARSVRRSRLDAPMDVPRCVAHLDMDAFYVSVELRRRPELRGLPVIVSGSGPRAVVTTASYEARKFGVGSAMPASQARRLCPQGVFLPPDFPYYRAASAEVMAIIRRNVETVEVVGLDEVYLELTGLPAPKAGMRRIVAEIREATGLSASVGIGPNKLVAKV